MINVLKLIYLSRYFPINWNYWWISELEDTIDLSFHDVYRTFWHQTSSFGLITTVSKSLDYREYNLDRIVKLVHSATRYSLWTSPTFLGLHSYLWKVLCRSVRYVEYFYHLSQPKSTCGYRDRIKVPIF